MPTLFDPTIGCKYTWGNREDSIVTMDSRIVLSSGVKIPLTVSIHRAILRPYFEPLKKSDDHCSRAIKFAFEKLGKRTAEPLEHSNLIESLAPESVQLLSDFKALERLRKRFFTFESLAENVACSLYDLCEKTPHAGRESISTPIFEHSRGAKVSASVESVRALKKFFSSPAPGTMMNHISYLSLMIQLFFLWGFTLRRVLSPARGRWAGNQLLGDYLPAAYVACRELIIMADKDSEIDRLIEGALEQLAATDPVAKSYLSASKTRPDSYRDQMDIVCLVYRAFHGAWQRYGLNGLPEPQDAFRQYLYGKREFRNLYKKTKDLSKDIYDSLRKEWIETYLAPNLGTAARVYRLI
jgi:hypothetical protein